MSDDDLFKVAEAYARRTDPETSHEAAETVPVARLEALVYAELLYCGDRGGNCQDVVELSGLDWNSVSPRFARLMEKGLIETRNGPDGKPITRPGKSHKAQTVYYVTDRTRKVTVKIKRNSPKSSKGET